MSRRSGTQRITEEAATEFDVVNPLLNAMYNEFEELSKKKPQEVISKGKVKLVNRILARVLELLKNEASRDFLDLLDEDDLPQNSDVVLMLGQCIAAMRSFEKRHSSAGEWLFGR